jgi:hypothetical protein
MFYTAILLLILLYFFAIFFRSETRSLKEMKHEEVNIKELFGSVGKSMISCFFYGTLLDGPVIVFDALLLDAGPSAAIVFVALIITSAFTVLNLLIGVLCEVVAAVSEEEKHRAEVKYLQDNLLDVLMAYDRNGDRHIKDSDFDFFLANPEVHDALAKFGTDVNGLKSLKNVLYEACGEDGLSFDQILDVVLRLQGDNVAKVTDIIDLREFMRNLLRLEDKRRHESDVKDETKSEGSKEPSASQRMDSPDDKPEAKGAHSRPLEAIMLRLDQIVDTQTEMRQEIQSLNARISALDRKASVS